VWRLTGRLSRGSTFVRSTVHRIEELLKAIFVPSVLFERFGFRYFGPVDGHDLPRLLWLFREIRKLHGPILVHVMTTKGKGYPFAERNATKFHGVGSFCLETGEPAAHRHPTYTEVFGRTLVELAEADPRLVAVTAAMADGTGLCDFANRFPDRFFDVGIAEGHAVTFAAGMARQGLKPVVAIYSTFLQRAFDPILHDVALQTLPVVFAVDRGGLVGEDGPTHHGSFDLSYLRLVPNLVVMAPKDENEFRDMLFTAARYGEGPVAVRYPRTETLGLPRKPLFEMLPIGRAETLRHGADVALFAVGDMVSRTLEAADLLGARGIQSLVVNARFVKPLDEDAVLMAARTCRLLVTLENNTVVGGFGCGVSEVLSRTGITGIRVLHLGLPDRFVPHGRLGDLFTQVGLDPQSIARTVEEELA
jgi:1-deoxy-D-xylulose-5-phosphate synthase